MSSCSRDARAQVPLVGNSEWDPVDIDRYTLGRKTVHGLYSGRVRLRVFAVPPCPTELEASVGSGDGKLTGGSEKQAGHKFKAVLDVICDLNALPSVGESLIDVIDSALGLRCLVPKVLCLSKKTTELLQICHVVYFVSVFAQYFAGRDCNEAGLLPSCWFFSW